MPSLMPQGVGSTRDGEAGAAMELRPARPAAPRNPRRVVGVFIPPSFYAISAALKKEPAAKPAGVTALRERPGGKTAGATTLRNAGGLCRRCPAYFFLRR